VKQDGLNYAWLYPGPHLNIVRNAEYEIGLTLLGFGLARNAVQPGETTTITLLWRIPPTDNQAVGSTPVELKLQDEHGVVWAESNGPVLAPAGPSPVEGHYKLDLPLEIPRGDYELWVALGQESHLAGHIPVRYLDKPAVEFPTSANFGDLITFGGAELDHTELSPDQPVNMTLWWQARQPISQSYTTFVHVVDEAGQIWGQVDRLPGDGRWPTNSWEQDEWLPDSFELGVKPDTPPGDYTLLIGWYDLQTLERLPLMAGTAGQTVLEIGKISVP
jgi:hypothetical protein